MIIGAGASALMFGAHSKERLLFVDANSSIGAKIKISGGTKCNLTNRHVSSQNYLGDKAFVKENIDSFNSADTLDFFAKYGVFPTQKDSGQYFCNSSKEVLSAFSLANSSHQFLFGRKVCDVNFNKEGFTTHLDNESIVSKKLVVASGGISYPKLNASDIGYKIAKKFAHEIKMPKPALVGLTLQKEQFWMRELSGISLHVKVKYEDFTYKGDMLFSHFGISGPVVLNTSLRWEKGKITIDFLPYLDLTTDSFMWNEKRQLTSIIDVPKRFVKAFLNSFEILDKPMKSYSNFEREKIVLLKKYTMSIAGTFGFNRAEITKGGVETTQINPKTFESRIQKGLYFIGEVLDVSGELGGYNLQWAFSSGANAAKNFGF
ncbi:MAG: aminoacetone oxidase family FAD-binding enzyme [Campylobacteraceae bacterium]|nr:aminoacetone oxidase family FAD-binding enzyme [Campylobacteraceae bacterium]